jgi:hypothetical protein
MRNFIIVLFAKHAWRMRWAGHVARIGRRGIHIGYWWDTEGKRPQGRPKCRWVDNIKIDLGEIGWDCMD